MSKLNISKYKTTTILLMKRKKRSKEQMRSLHTLGEEIQYKIDKMIFDELAGTK